MLTIHPALLFFFFTLNLGILITISSSSWFGCWLGLELNLISFVPLLTSKYDTYSSEAALKYFLIQALGSATILISVSCNFLNAHSINLMIFIALLLKSGAAPLHFWFPPVMQGIKFTQCIILMTLQKIAPMTMISYTLHMESIWLPLFLTSILSSVVGALGGLNQTLIRKIMAYSSINHMAWMLAAISISTSLWGFYFIIYSIVTTTVMLLFYSQQILHIKQVVNTTIESPFVKVALFFNLISLGGLPPFLGFVPKALLINVLTLNSQFIWLSVLLFSALITLFFYLRLSLTAFTMVSHKTKLSQHMHTKSFMILTLVNLFPLVSPLLLLPPY